MFHFCPLKSLPSSDPHQKLGAEHCESNGDHSSVCSMCPMRKVEPPPIFESTKDPSQGWFNVWAFGKRAGLLFMWTGLNSIPAADWGGGGGLNTSVLSCPHLLLTSPTGPETFDGTSPQAKVSTDLCSVMFPSGSSAGLTFLCVPVTYPLLTQKSSSRSGSPGPGQPLRAPFVEWVRRCL